MKHPTGALAVAYDRRGLRRRSAHLGVGAFHRAHQETYFDDLARAGGDWGVVGINLTPPHIASTHRSQNGIYSVLTADAERARSRTVGTLMDVHDAAQAAEIGWRHICLVTLTVTEKGYCHRSGTTELDQQTIAPDLAAPRAPRTAIGYLAWMLEQRRLNDGGPITLASCDNIPGNGRLLASVMQDYVSRTFPDLLPWMARNVTFPNSMVDRIVPLMSTASRARLEDALGAKDALGVVAEPFRQWVIEDRFAAARPAWERVGVQVVTDVEPYEHMKHRLLNGLQSAYAELGRLCGFETSYEAASDEDLAAWARAFLVSQAKTLSCPDGEDLELYGRTSLARLQNPLIRHPLNQIASDASFKLPQRIAVPAAELLAQRDGAEAQAMVLAAWTMQAGDDSADSAGVRTSDPMARTLATLRHRHETDADALAAAFLNLPILPTSLAASAGFGNSVARWIRRFGERDVEARRWLIGDFAKRLRDA